MFSIPDRTRRTRFTRVLMLGVGLLIAGIGFTTVGASHAEARVPDGFYNYQVGPIPGAVPITNGVMAGAGPIHQTRNGGYLDIPGGRVTFVDRGHGRFTGDMWIGGTKIAPVTLTPRR